MAQLFSPYHESMRMSAMAILLVSSQSHPSIPILPIPPWHIKSHQGYLHPLPVRPDKADQLEEGDPKAGDRV